MLTLLELNCLFLNTVFLILFCAMWIYIKWISINKVLMVYTKVCETHKDYCICKQFLPVLPARMSAVHLTHTVDFIDFREGVLNFLSLLEEKLFMSPHWRTAVFFFCISYSIKKIKVWRCYRPQYLCGFILFTCLY